MSETEPTLTEAEREADLLIEVGHPSRPDRYQLMHQHIERIKADARREAIEDVAAVMDLSYEYVADLVERQAGR